MSKAETLLLEIGTEELPAKALAESSAQLEQNLCAALKSGGLSYADTKAFATPRRLAVKLEQVPLARAGSSSLRIGPPVAAARNKDGSWSSAANGFARSCGVNAEQLEIVSDGKLDRVACKVVQPEQQVADLLPDMVCAAVAQLRFARSMRWGTCEQAFLRPVRWLLLMHGSTSIDFSMFGISSSAYSYGHRQHLQAIKIEDADPTARQSDIGLTEHHPQAIKIEDADPTARQPDIGLTEHHPKAIKIESAKKWQAALSTAKVIACMEDRRKEIDKQLKATASELGYTVDTSGGLLDEVNALVEYPVAIHGSFDQAYLQLPKEVLRSVLQKQQRYFPLLYKGGTKKKPAKLAPAFIAISGTASSDPGLVRQGYENVLQARLSDAKFFWERDCKRGLEDMKPELEGIIFHNKLGSIADRSRQIADAAAAIAKELRCDDRLADLARRAGALCKCDLPSETVGEFPELQGIIGGRLAAKAGEELDVWFAIDQHYKPAHSGDSIPDTEYPSVANMADDGTIRSQAYSEPFALGTVLALADKLNLVAGIHSIGEMPSAEKDPFAVRRTAIGVLRILIEGKIDIDLPALLDIALQPFNCDKPTSELMEFFKDRLRAHCIEKGDAPQIVDAVLAVAPDNPYDVIQRIDAMKVFVNTPSALQLIAIHKRVRNILRQSGADAAKAIQQDLLVHDAEKELAKQTKECSKKCDEFLSNRDYLWALELLSNIQPAADEFFDKVKVMDDDLAIRGNRLALLSELMKVFTSVADLTRLDG